MTTEESGKQITTHLEAEIVPEYGVEQIDIDYKLMLEKYRERSVMLDGIRKDALSKTKPHNWLARKDKNGTVTLSLMAPGAERIKMNCPIGFLNIVRKEEKWSTDEGPGYTIYREALVYVGTPSLGTLPVMSSCRSDSDFFSTEYAELPYVEENPEHKALIESGEGRLSFDKKSLHIRRRIPASEVHKDLIEKTALTQLYVAGVTRVLGIRQIAPEELTDVGIDITKIPTIEYGSGKAKAGKLAPATEQKRGEIWDMLLELHNGDGKKAAEDMKKRTAFNDYAGTSDPQRLTEKQIPYLYEKVKADYMKTREGAAPEKTQKKGDQKAGGQSELL